MDAKNQKISAIDWGKIHAKAWLDDEFRNKLETDPTAALREFAAEHGLKWGRLVRVEERPETVTDETLADILSGKTSGPSTPPACC